MSELSKLDHGSKAMILMYFININNGNQGNLVVYVAQTVHRFAHHTKCVQRCQTYLFVSNKRKFTIKIT
jgi:hypothetical protein